MSELLVDKERVIDRVNELFIATDERAWDRVQACFTPSVRFDMSSLTGQTATTISAAQIAGGWRAGLAALEAVHHQIGNYRVGFSGAEADVFCYGTATHFRKVASGRNTRTFVGTYDIHLVRRGNDWLIDRFRFNAKYVDGNLSLDSEA